MKAYGMFCVMQGPPEAGPGHFSNLVQQSLAGHRRPPLVCSGVHWHCACIMPSSKSVNMHPVSQTEAIHSTVAKG